VSRSPSLNWKVVRGGPWRGGVLGGGCQPEERRKEEHVREGDGGNKEVTIKGSNLYHETSM
jgi:hypothetical protein